MNAQHPSDLVEIFKASLATGEILGLIDVETVKDRFDKKDMVLVGGLTANPEYSHAYNRNSSISGIGKVLLAKAISWSLERHQTRIGINSSLGSEGFYRKLGFQERLSFDGIRTFFYVEGEFAMLELRKRCLKEL